MCNIWAKKAQGSELNVSDWDNFFRQADYFSWVGITGGEPFLRPDVGELTDIILQYSRKLKVIHFATNGTLTGKIEALVQRLRQKDKKTKLVFTISIDGPPQLHDQIRGQEGVWEKAIASFCLLKKIENVKPQFGFTISHNNLNSFSNTFWALKQVYPALRFDDLTVNIFQKSSFYYENQQSPGLPGQQLAEQIRKILAMDKDVFSLNNFLRRRYLKLYLKYLKTKKCPLKCQALSSTCFLDPIGNLFPCAVYNKKLLNIKTLNRHLSKEWCSPAARTLSYECSHQLCPSCWSPCDAYSAIGGSLIQSSLA
jgi:MoaA/NifB/PqqE/SkfB family radical SAM enzyme